MDVAAKLFGIPRVLRTESRIHEIIQRIGHASAWNMLNPRNINLDPYYAAIRIKIDVNLPLKDKIILSVAGMGNMPIWIHYEKVRRVCTFCARLFHNAEHCPDRLHIIATTRRNPGFGFFSLGMINDIHIPWDLVRNQIDELLRLTTPPSQALNALREAFVGISVGEVLGTLEESY